MRPAPITAKNLKFKQYALWLGVTALVTSMFWIAVEIYNAYAEDPVDENITKLTQTLNPTLDLEVLNQINNRQEPPANFQISAGSTAVTSTTPDNRTIDTNSSASQAASLNQSETNNPSSL